MNRAFCRSRNLNTVLPIGLPGHVAGRGIAIDNGRLVAIPVLFAVLPIGFYGHVAGRGIALDDGRLVAIPVSFVIFEMCLAGNYAGCLINDLLYPYPYAH